MEHLNTILAILQLVFVAEDEMHDLSLLVGDDEWGLFQVGHIYGGTGSSFTFPILAELHAEFIRIEATDSRLQLCEVQVFAKCLPGEI